MRYKEKGWTFLITFICLFLISIFIYNKSMTYFLEILEYLIYTITVLSFFTSVYYFCFAYPKNKIKIPLFMNSFLFVFVTTILIIGVIILTQIPGGGEAGMAIFLIPYIFGITIITFLISLIISSWIIPIENIKMQKKKSSILKLPFIVSLIYFLLFELISFLEYLMRDGFNRALQDIVPLFFFLAFFSIAVLATLFFDYIQKNIKNIKLWKKISLIVFIVSSIGPLLATIDILSNNLIKLLAIESIVLISALIGPFALLFYLTLLEREKN